MGYVRLNGSYNILKSLNFQVAGIPSLCKEKNMNVKSMSYTGKVLWTLWELDVEDYEILSSLFFKNASELRYLHVKVEPKLPSLCPGVDQIFFFWNLDLIYQIIGPLGVAHWKIGLLCQSWYPITHPNIVLGLPLISQRTC